MSNTYFEINKQVETKGFGELDGYTHDYELSLTAFCGGKNVVQLTIQTQCTKPSMSGTAYIVLSEKDIDNLIIGLLERRSGRISATGVEQSLIMPPKTPY